jgi:hypothetical protein
MQTLDTKPLLSGSCNVEPLRELSAEFEATGRAPSQAAMARAIVRAGLDRPVYLRDRTVGYRPAPARGDDCFRAAAATVLQVPPALIPDSQIDARLAEGWNADHVSRSAWGTFLDWLSLRGLRMVVHRDPPVTLARWVGVVPFPGDFADHCLVMARGRILWDPADLTPAPPPFVTRPYAAHEVTMGYSFTPTT